MDAHDAGRNHVGCFCQQLILDGRTIVELHIAVEQEQRGQQNACTVISDQRSPRLTRGARQHQGNHPPNQMRLPHLPAPPRRLDRTPRHHCRSRRLCRCSGLMIVPRTVRISSWVSNSGSAPPQMTGNHSLGRNQLWSHDYAGQKAIEVRQAHAVVRGMVGHQVFVECIKIDRAVLKGDCIPWRPRSPSLRC